jgi:hypothetical protein
VNKSNQSKVTDEIIPSAMISIILVVYLFDNIDQNLDSNIISQGCMKALIIVHSMI